jgi:N-acetyl-alpha-D-glucosaminyl L-malate synthase BshA
MTATPMRIGVVCYPSMGGSGIVATEIGLGLARRGHDVHFVAYDVPPRLAPALDEVTFHRVEWREYPLLNLSPYPLALATKLAEVSTTHRLDLLHIHYATPHATSAFLARQILGHRSPRIVTTLHGTDITLVGSDPALLPVTRLSLLHSDALAVPSEYLRQAAHVELSLPTELPIDVIPNFVDTDYYAPAPRRPELVRARLGLPPGGGAPPPLLVHASNFRPLKRVDDLVRVLAAVRREVPALLALVGDGPERPRAEALARELGVADAVRFLGAQLDFRDLLQQADVFLLPSATEGFGLAALEALACGVPVVASCVGGLPEVVTDGETGFLRPPGDVAAMAAATLRLLQDAPLRARHARAARASVELRWRREPLLDRWEACFRRVLGARR